MLMNPTGRAATKAVSAKHGPAARAPPAAKHTSVAQGASPSGGTATAAAATAARSTTVPDRSRRAEALVRHVTQLPTFLTWAAANSAEAATAAALPRGVAQYLEERVAEMAAQLDSLQHAGDYARLVVLLTELLHGDMGAGVTPRMIDCGLLKLLRATATAVANGEHATLPAAVSVALSSTGQTFTAPSAATKRGAGDYAGTAPLSSQNGTHGGGGGDVATAGMLTIPIESLLPPLIDQTVRKPKGKMGSLDSGTASPKQTEDEAEMEAWENYMATVRVATTTADAPHARDAVVRAVDAGMTPGFAAATAAGVVGAATVENHTCTIQSLPDALCALIASCTAAPFISLTLPNQQCEKAAVVSVADALIAMAAEIRGDSAELAGVRLAAIQGLYLLLSNYIAGRKGGSDNTASQVDIWRGVQPSKVRNEGPTATSASPALLLDSEDLAQMLDDVTLDWAHILARLGGGYLADGTQVQPSGEGGNKDSSSDEEAEAGEEGDAVAAAAAAAANSGAIAELNWVLKIALLLLHAQQHVRQRGGGGGGGAVVASQPPFHALPRHLLPVVLRTLALLPTTPALSARAATYSRQCVDVLWTASLLAPVAAARQLLYGSLPLISQPGAAESDIEETGSPAVDFFLALLHQFNETHSLAHREMRDDLVSLLALLLRCDRQFVEDELMLRRGVTDGVEAAAFARRERSSSSSSSPLPYNSAASSPVGHGDDNTAGSPLSLSVATVEAVNAIVALLFETTCGAELGASAVPHTLSSRTGGATREEVRPSALLSEEAVRNYALRFQSVTISAARRREVVEFKKYGWQLLGVHTEWQLAHLTFREYINLHDPAVPSSSSAAKKHHSHHPHHERSSPIPQVTGEAARDEAVTAALWAMQLSRLGFFDVLLLYVDMDSSVPAVVTWTREELMLLEQEAWQLFTSMILFTQHLDAVSGGICVRRRRCYGATSFSHGSGAMGEEQRTSYSNGLSGASIGAGEEDEMTNADDEDEANGGVLYGADIHFIAAGGVGVALRFLTAAPAEMEAVKRSALVTLAAIARTSSSGEAHLHSGTYSTKDLALVHRALTEYAPSLVPFLVRIIREVDAHVDATGMPATAPSLITASVTAAMARNAGVESGARASMSVQAAEMEAAQTVGQWGWLPYSAGLSVVFAWCLLRSIGDVVLMEVGMVRELPDLTVDRERSDTDSDEEEESVHDVKNNTRLHNHHNHHHEDDKISPMSSCAGTARQSAVGQQYSVGSLPPPEDRLEGTGILFHGATMAETTGRGGGGGEHEVQLYPAELNISMVDDDDNSSSGSSMGSPPGEEAASVVAAPIKSFGGRKSGTGRVRGTASTGPKIVSTTINMCNQHIPDADASSGDSPARRRTLLRSVHEDVLLIPEMFAAEGGIDALVVWIRHSLRLCLTARGHTTQSSLHYRAPLPELSAEEVAELDAQSDLFLLLLDVFRAIVLGSEGNEEMFVRCGGVHGLLDLIEAFALAHGLIRRAADHARTLAVDISTTAYQLSSTSSARDASKAQRVKEGRGVLHYATTLLSDLLDNCPCTLDEFATWHSGLLFTSPLAPDVQECWSGSKGVEAVQLLLCLWAADLPARSDLSSTTTTTTTTTTVVTGLELLRVHLRPALRMALKAEYVSRLLQRRARMGALEAEAIRSYYRYIHSDSTYGVAAEEEVTDAVVLAFMEQLMLSHRKRNAVPADQQIALLVNDTLGLCLKVHGCLAAVGFDSLQAAETETAASPSLHVNLSSLERSVLVQIAALPALCVDEISTAMAEVALGNLDGAGEGSGGFAATESSSVAAWRPTTPDRTTLSTAATESAIRASELDQIIEVGAQVQQARQEQLYHRYLVTQLRQPVAPPADGRPGAVRGAWKTQRRLSTTVGGSPVTAAHGAASSVRGGVQQGEQAVELAARLSTRLAAEEQQLQRSIAATVFAKSTMRHTQSGREEEGKDNSEGSARLMSTAPPALGSSRTPYPKLMGSAHGAAMERQLATTTLNVSAPPRRPAVPLTERHQKRRAMIARSVRKAPVDGAVMKEGRKP